MTAYLNGIIVPRIPAFKGEIPVVNLSSSVTIFAGAVLKIDSSNDPATVYAATPGQVGLAVAECTAGAQPVGVAVADIPPGQQGSMQVDGFIPVQNSAAGSIAVGALVIPDSGGQVKTTGGAGSPCVGIAWSPGASQGDTILCQLMLGPTDIVS
jgi:predicted RecA/RadA family phage recombinase